MALTKFSVDVNNIQKLADQPTDTPTNLKKKFDKAGSDIKTYLNDTLTSEIDSEFGNKISNTDIAIVSLSGNDAGNTEVSVEYPTGFTYSNCVVLNSYYTTSYSLPGNSKKIVNSYFDFELRSSGIVFKETSHTVGYEWIVILKKR